MATIKLVRRLSNPRRKARKRNPSSARRRRRITRRRTNPALVLTLGAVNPVRKRRKNTMKKSRKRSRRRNPVLSLFAPVRKSRRRRGSRRRNPIVVRYTRRHRRRRNPIFTTANWSMVGGGLVGVAATRFVGQIIPVSLLGFAGSVAPLLRDALAAIVVSFGGSKLVGAGSSDSAKARFADGITFGALMQVASTGIAAFVPSLRNYGFGISGMGYMMPASFPVPQNPLAIPAPAPAPNARVTANGLTRAFGTAF